MSTWAIIIIFGALGAAWAWFIYSRTDEQMVAMTRPDQTTKPGRSDDVIPIVPGVGAVAGVMTPEMLIHEQ